MKSILSILIVIVLTGCILADETKVDDSSIIFQENFDSIDDWDSGMGFPPENWERFRRGEEHWNPGNGHPDRHNTLEILSINSDKARGGSGKSMVHYRESIDKGKTNWRSDGILTKSLEEGVDEIYVEFYIMFSPDFTSTSPSGATKIFRISSNDSVKKGRPHEYYLGFKSGHNGPMFIQVYSVGSYGARNFLAFRGDPYYRDGESMYYLTSNEMGPLPRNIHMGDMSLNFGGNLRGMGKDGADPQVPDQLNGGYLSMGEYDIVSHEQIYGPLGSWQKFAYYVKMNSSPEKKDGAVIQWLNDERIFSNFEMQWHRYRDDGEIPKWNSVSFGGNSYFPRFDHLDRFEDWYAIDDITIRNTIPKELR